MINFIDFCKTLGFQQVNESQYGKYLQYWLELKQIDERTILLYMNVDRAFSLEKMKEALLERAGVIPRPSGRIFYQYINCGV